MNNQSSIKMTDGGFEIRNDIGEVIALISSESGELELFNGKSYVTPESISTAEGYTSGSLNISKRGISTYINKSKMQRMKQVSKVIFNLTRLAVFIYLTVKEHKLSKSIDLDSESLAAKVNTENAKNDKPMSF